VVTVAERAGPVASAQRVRASRITASRLPAPRPAPRPGGIGTREEVENRTLLDWLARRAAEAEIVTPSARRRAPRACGSSMAARDD